MATTKRYDGIFNMLVPTIVLAIAVTVSGPSVAQGTAKTLRVVPHADLAGLDPTVSSATITADHSYLVYDMLSGLDANMMPQPQMVDTYTISPDKLTYRFTLRN